MSAQPPTIVTALPGQGWTASVGLGKNEILCWLVRSDGQISPVLVDHRGVAIEVHDSPKQRLTVYPPEPTECGCAS